MSGRCPFCWGLNVYRAGHSPGRRRDGGSGDLMQCADCEKWFRAGSGEEIPLLFEICATLMVNPGLCHEEVRETVNSGGTAFHRRRAAEFNHICSDCLRARFLRDRWPAHV
jgi:hypothetical protein